ncbi:hypothetical protein BFW87_02655 [Pseudomonas fluorescens]|uniref:Uncharacterized protein n=1 Tax=Pseudomonas fluorescens TaxID=294 RepID=A0A1T2Z6W0_PSEFL|nr:hypothetical protein BFW87_02655 [Pseudomonas fluorescens]
MWELACVGAGLPAMQSPRCISCTAVMLSQASQLPHLLCVVLEIDYLTADTRHTLFPTSSATSKSPC